MSVAKVIEISAESTENFEDAIKRGINEVNKTIKNVRGAWVSEQKVVVEDGRITRFRVYLRVSFVID